MAQLCWKRTPCVRFRLNLKHSAKTMSQYIRICGILFLFYCNLILEGIVVGATYSPSLHSRYVTVPEKFVFTFAFNLTFSTKSVLPS